MPISMNPLDILKESKRITIIIILTGITLLSITILINIFFTSLIGFYLTSFFLLFFAIFPSKGRRITENCWVSPSERDDFLVTLNDRKILIKGERLRGKPDHAIYADDSPKWLPPYESELVPEKDYVYMLKAILNFLQKLKKDGVIEKYGKQITLD